MAQYQIERIQSGRASRCKYRSLERLNTYASRPPNIPSRKPSDMAISGFPYVFVVFVMNALVLLYHSRNPPPFETRV